MALDLNKIYQDYQASMEKPMSADDYAMWRPGGDEMSPVSSMQRFLMTRAGTDILLPAGINVLAEPAGGALVDWAHSPDWQKWVDQFGGNWQKAYEGMAQRLFGPGQWVKGEDNPFQQPLWISNNPADATGASASGFPPRSGYGGTPLGETGIGRFLLGAGGLAIGALAGGFDPSSLFSSGAAGAGQTLATDAFIMGGPGAYGSAAAGAAGASAAGIGLDQLGGQFLDPLSTVGTDVPWGVNPQTWSNLDELGGQFLDPLSGGPSNAWPSGWEQLPAPVQEGPTFPSTGPGGSVPPITPTSPFNRDYGPNNPSTPSTPSGAPFPSGAVPGTGTALSRILSDLKNGTNIATAADYVSVLGTVGATGLGILGANAQTNAYQDVANRFIDLGAPYRALNLASYQPGFSMQNEPGYSDALANTQSQFLRAASAGRAPGVARGNPFDNPGAWAETMKYVNANLALPALTSYRSGLERSGGLGLGAGANASLAGAGTAGGIYNALGSGLSNLTNPPSTVNTDLLNQLLQLQIAKLSTAGVNA